MLHIRLSKCYTFASHGFLPSAAVVVERCFHRCLYSPLWTNRHPPGRHPLASRPPSRLLLQRTVRILLECILVMYELKPWLKLKHRSRISLHYRILYKINWQTEGSCVVAFHTDQFHDTCSRFIYFEWNSVQLILHDRKIYQTKTSPYFSIVSECFLHIRRKWCNWHKSN